jgi:hypothetical protein
MPPTHFRPGSLGSDPAKIVTDLAVMLGVGGDCMDEIAMLRRRALAVAAVVFLIIDAPRGAVFPAVCAVCWGIRRRASRRAGLRRRNGAEADEKAQDVELTGHGRGRSIDARLSPTFLHQAVSGWKP